MATIDEWYALPFEERNKQTYDQWSGNVPAADTSRLPPSDFPGAASFKIEPPPTNTTPGGTGGEATTQQATPTDYSSFRVMSGAPIDANTIAGYYSKYLNRAPNADEVYYASGHPGGAPALEDFIKNSAEAAAYALSSQARQRTIGPAAPVQQIAGSGASTAQAVTNPYDRNDPANYGTGGTFNVPAPGNAANEIAGYISRFTGRAPTTQEVTEYLKSGKSLGQIQNEIANGSEAQGFAARGGSANNSQTTNATTPYSNDPHASLFENTVLSRLAQLRQPIDTSAQDAYVKQALDRVQQLSGAPFTDTQSAALLTQHMEPLTQARDQAKQQAAEQMSRRGITPSSGVFVDAMNKIDQAYERGVANVTNTLNIKGIDQTTQNQNAKLAILNSIVDMSRATQMQQEGLSSQLVPTAATLTNLDSSRLASLLSASNGSGDPSGLIGALTGVGNLGLNNQNQQNQQSAASSAALAQLIYALMNGSAGLLH